MSFRRELIYRKASATRRAASSLQGCSLATSNFEPSALVTGLEGESRLCLGGREFLLVPGTLGRSKARYTELLFKERAC